MIQANELRIGNWVVYNHPKKPYNIQMDLDHLCRVAIEQANYEPIPLTPELLEKYGFVKINGGGIAAWQIKISKDASIEWHDDNSVLIGDYFGEGYNPFAIENISTLHQLQNLYYALTGEELLFQYLKK